MAEADLTGVTPGAVPGPDGRWEFTVWAPNAGRVELDLPGHRRGPLALAAGSHGYWHAAVEGLIPGDRYRFVLDGRLRRPDPASAGQPDGVHAASALVDLDGYSWSDASFLPAALDDLIIYELHVGTFTGEGTFAAAGRRLPHLLKLGVNAVELMPVASFPGGRNWGYDGVFPFAVQQSYGGPLELQRFVDLCHENGVTVILDVVYNHLGPEGNYLRDFGPYFTDRYRTPWGEAVNLDGPGSDGVRNFFLTNARFWFEKFHIDGLRLDAVHAIFDARPRHFLAELALLRDACSRRTGRRRLLIAETNANDPRLVTPLETGGLGMDAAWSDDFHHAVHTLLTGEKNGYYQDYGRFEQLADAVARGFVYTGQYSAYRGRSHGMPGDHLPGASFVIGIQTHDQVGNRMEGERIDRLVDFEARKTAAALLFLTPFTPLLFMGEEWGETRPFLYFTSHGDAELIEAVRRGRKREFAAFGWQDEPPDPQSADSFLASKLDWGKLSREQHRTLFEFYRRLIALRKTLAPLSRPDRRQCRFHSFAPCPVLVMERRAGGERCLALFNFSRQEQTVRLGECLGPERWIKVLDTAAAIHGGKGSTLSETPSDTAALGGWQSVLYHGKTS